MTQTEIIAEIKRIEEKSHNLQKNIPGYYELINKANKLREKYFEKIKPELKQLTNWKYDLKRQLVEAKNKGKLEIPDDLKKWFYEYSSGTNWGYKSAKIVWFSENHEWVIITYPGGTAGQGTAMGTGGYYYSSSSHWLENTKINKVHASFQRKRFGEEIEGRLTKEKKQQLINLIPTL